MVKNWAEKVWSFFKKEKNPKREELKPINPEKKPDEWTIAAKLNRTHLGRFIQVDTGIHSDYHTSLVVGTLQSIRRDDLDPGWTHLRIVGNSWVASLSMGPQQDVFLF